MEPAAANSADPADSPGTTTDSATTLAGSTTYRVRTTADRTVVAVEGDIDAATAPALRTVLAELVEDHAATLRLDLTNVDFIDSVGLSVLVAVENRAQQGGFTFELASVPPQCSRLLAITRLDEVFSIVP